MIIRQHGQAAPSNRGSLFSAAQKAAVEKRLSNYLYLICGHLSTWEVDRIYSFGRPAKNKSWCEECSKWVTIKQRVTTKEKYPDVPMF